MIADSTGMFTIRGDSMPSIEEGSVKYGVQYVSAQKVMEQLQALEHAGNGFLPVAAAAAKAAAADAR